MDKGRSSARVWRVVAVIGLLLAFFAYGSNVQGWMANGVAVPLALLGVVGFAGATLVAALGRGSRRRGP